MRRAAFWLWASLAIALVNLLGPGGPITALADQRDNRLDGLFERLQTTSDPGDAATLQHRIWQIWIESGDPASSQLMRRGMTAMANGDHDNALDAFNTLVEQAPDFAEAWNKRATVYYLLGRLDESVNDIQHTLELEPRHFGALSGLALIYDAVEQPEAAIRSLEAALEINPHLQGSEDRINQLREKMKGTRT
ncbi:MAG: tetratricopeptide repeat protein [Alphaproteobacteria bacterium]|nr:tetratricopeptide repeat protein [Alphaproteobacteria bacterium]